MPNSHSETKATPRVFGIGWAKTGTTSLGQCFRKLGYRHCSRNLRLVRDLMRGRAERVLGIAGQYESFEDWPWILIYRELDERFPGSRFVLTVRSTDRWIRSYRNMVARERLVTPGNDIRDFLFGFPFRDASDAQLKERYEQHNHDVRNYFRSRPDDLVVVNWEEGCGWDEICEFLGKPVPPEPFPHANSSSEKRSVRGLLSTLSRRLRL